VEEEEKKKEKIMVMMIDDGDYKQNFFVQYELL
jgi:hypothetical protein